MQKKIRNATMQKIPFQLIVGEDDRANGAVSFRFRDGTQENGVPVDDAIRRILASITSRAQVLGTADFAEGAATASLTDTAEAGEAVLPAGLS
jgi:threonyl-tRNA synthetase